MVVLSGRLVKYDQTQAGHQDSHTTNASIETTPVKWFRGCLSWTAAQVLRGQSQSSKPPPGSTKKVERKKSQIPDFALPIQRQGGSLPNTISTVTIWRQLRMVHHNSENEQGWIRMRDGRMLENNLPASYVFHVRSGCFYSTLVRVGYLPG